MPHPHKLPDDQFHRWVAAKVNTSERFVYTGESLRAVAMPLGGIGCGEFCIAGDGSLRQWQIFNQVNHDCFIPYSFFAITTRTGQGQPNRSKALIWDGLYDDEAFDPPASSSDHVVPDELAQMMLALPPVDGVEFIGEYPIAQLRYLDETLPVQVQLEAFSPMVPLDSRASGYPAAVFIFTVGNPTDRAVSGALMASLQNAVGYDTKTPVTGVSCPCYGGNLNEVTRDGQATTITMRSLSAREDDAGFGSMALVALSTEATAAAQWDDIDALWRDFSADGQLRASYPKGPSAQGQTWNGALAVPFQLDPGQEARITFLIAWHFPNHYVNWGQSWFGVSEGKNRYYIGNQYNNRFGSVSDVVRELVANLGSLTEQTRLWRDTFYDSTLPYWLLDCISCQTSTIRTPTCIWNEDGSFHGFEGGCGASTGHCDGAGCCPLNCTHVWNYEMSLSKLYPDLERSMRRTDLIEQLGPRGQIPHRTVLPFYLPRWGKDDPRGEILACDGHWGTILKAYREYRQGGGAEFLDEMWEPIKKAMAFGISKWDPDEDGVLSGEQWNTYDLFFFGANTFCTGLYLAALRAAEEMAKVRGDGELVRYWRSLFEKGSAWVDANLFNGEYYEQRFYEDEPRADHHQYGKGCLSDQLLGQWWAHALDLGHILDPQRIRAAYASVYTYNFWHDFYGHQQQPRTYVDDRDKGLITTSWPHGGRQTEPMLYADECWSSLAYHVAGGMLWEGMVEEAWHLVRATRERFDGTRRNPFNEVECGDHYARPMANWALLEAACGWAYSAPDKTMRLAPIVRPGNLRCPFITATGWGTFSQSREPERQVDCLDVKWGAVALRTLTLELAEGTGAVTVSVSAAGAPVPAEWSQDGDRVTLVLPEGFVARAGERLVVELSCS